MRYIRWFAHAVSHLSIAVILVIAAGVLAWHDKQAMCLAEALYHEVRGDKISDEERILVALVTIARAIDTDPQWAKTVCGVVAQKHQYSWVKNEAVATQRDEKKRWEHSVSLARKVYWGFGTKYAFPFGGECIRFYKRADDRDVSEKSKRFFAKLAIVRELVHGFYKDPKGCQTKMPTTLSASVAL